MRPDTDDYKRLFLNDVPLFDVRAPIEFARGAFPGAVNLPLMTDREREQVGIAYKNEGQTAAIALGNMLVQAEVKEARIRAWRAFAEAHPGGYLYCFRGGLRSQTSQAWLREAGTDYPLVTGGYKAMRRYLIDILDSTFETQPFVVIAGRTGVGKTLFLEGLGKAVDLEGLAGHRGSSFGRRVAEQPTQIDFENRLAVDLLKLMNAADLAYGPIFIEDESNRIGQRQLPERLATGIKAWPMVILNEPLEERVAIIHKDYIVDLLAEHEAAYGERGFDAFSAFLRSGFARIKNRLGGVNYDLYTTRLEDALAAQRSRGDTALHRVWIEGLLRDYYDPMYDYQLSRKDQPILFSGTRQEAYAFCSSLTCDGL